jgi:hypothetical protein
MITSLPQTDKVLRESLSVEAAELMLQPGARNWWQASRDCETLGGQRGAAAKSRGTPDRRRCDEKASGKMLSAFGAMTLKANEAERLRRGNLLRGTNHIFCSDRS